MAKPRRAEKDPEPGSRFPSQVLADNVRVFRLLRRFKQSDLAARMTELGHRWYATTVSEVENALRSVTIDELVGLAIILQFGVPILLDPTGPEGANRDALIDVGAPDGPITAEQVWSAITDERPSFYVFFEGNTAKKVGLVANREQHEWRKQERALKPGWSGELGGKG